MFTGYKKWFSRGLATLLPTLVTLFILFSLIAFINNNLGKYIGIGVTNAIGWAWPELGVPGKEEVDNYLRAQGITVQSTGSDRYKQAYEAASKKMRNQHLHTLGRSWVMALFGFVIALILITIIGIFLASFIGRQLWQSIERTIVRIPIVRQIYPYVKQVTDYIFGQRKLDFSQVVAVPYPSKGLWQIGFITGPALGAFQAHDPQGREFITVFVPTSPTPFTGYVVVVPKEEILNLPMTIDQAFRFLLSGGVINPEVILLPADTENNPPKAGHGSS